MLCTNYLYFECFIIDINVSFSESKLFLISSKLSLETTVRLAARACGLYLLEASIIIDSVFFHHIGTQEHRASRNTSCAMNQDISFFPLVFNKLESRFKSMDNFLGAAVIKIKLFMGKFFWILEAEIYS